MEQLNCGGAAAAGARARMVRAHQVPLGGHGRTEADHLVVRGRVDVLGAASPRRATPGDRAGVAGHLYVVLAVAPHRVLDEEEEQQEVDEL